MTDVLKVGLQGWVLEVLVVVNGISCFSEELISNLLILWSFILLQKYWEIDSFFFFFFFRALFLSCFVNFSVTALDWKACGMHQYSFCSERLLLFGGSTGKQWLSGFTVHQKHLGRLRKYSYSGLTLQNTETTGLWWAWAAVFLKALDVLRCS